MQACPALYSTYMLVLPQGVKRKRNREKMPRLKLKLGDEIGKWKVEGSGKNGKRGNEKGKKY